MYCINPKNHGISACVAPIILFKDLTPPKELPCLQEPCKKEDFKRCNTLPALNDYYIKGGIHIQLMYFTTRYKIWVVQKFAEGYPQKYLITGQNK